MDVEKWNSYMNIYAAVGFSVGRRRQWSIQIYKGPAFTLKDSLLSSLPRALDAFYQTILSLSDAVFYVHLWPKSMLKKIKRKDQISKYNKIK